MALPKKILKKLALSVGSLLVAGVLLGGATGLLRDGLEEALQIRAFTREPHSRIGAGDAALETDAERVHEGVFLSIDRDASHVERLIARLSDDELGRRGLPLGLQRGSV